MFFAIIGIVELGIVGTMVQSNSIAGSVNEAFGIPIFVITIVLAITVALILIGGMGRIASFSEKVIPFMAGLYIVGSVVIIFMNINNLFLQLKVSLWERFPPGSNWGGVLGITVQQTIRFGLARGLFQTKLVLAQLLIPMQ